MLAGVLGILVSLVRLAYPSQIPLLDDSDARLEQPVSDRTLISTETDTFVKSLLASWNSSGLAIAVVRQNKTIPGGWIREFASYGVATADGTPVTPDTLFSIASNSKLFLSLSVGLLISNETLAKERGRELHWNTRAKDLFPQWEMMDEYMNLETNIQDMLTHRTGMPGHDHSGLSGTGSVPEMVRLHEMLNSMRNILM